MKNVIKLKCPAKINLTLDVVNRRPDGFHEINSVMQLINLYDYITIKIEHAHCNQIILSGNSTKIPYDKNNLVYKAVELYCKETGLKNLKIDIYIEKNIPIAAGLAGGSTDAAGTLWGLNYIFQRLDLYKLNELSAKLGSDLNVCLHGGCCLATSRGEVLEGLPTLDYELTLIKPKNLGISAKEAYSKFDTKKLISSKNYTDIIIQRIWLNSDIIQYMHNDLEDAVFDDYKELQDIKAVIPEAIMSGSGPTYFVLKNIKDSPFNADFEFINNLCFINTGIELVDLQ